MRIWRTLVRRELGGYFVSWTGYVVIAVVAALLGLCFVGMLQALNAEKTEQPIMELFYVTPYFWIILILTSPVITMRSFAMEKSTGTFETLMTTPVSDLQVVLAKFSGAMIFYLLMWSPLAACLFIVRHFSHDPTVVQAGTVASTALGIALLGGLYMSLGCFASSLTRNQIIASMFSFALGFALFMPSLVPMAMTGRGGWAQKIFAQLLLVEHMHDFAHGVVDVRSLVFYLSLTALFLFLTLKAVESRRWK
jgi:ABC-2 type transport system permease protein